MADNCNCPPGRCFAEEKNDIGQNSLSRCTKQNGRWTEGVCGDRAVFLRDGWPVPITEVLAKLNQSEWQPMATAPLDGTFVLCALESGHVTVLQFCQDGYWRYNAITTLRAYPVAWMLLPWRKPTGSDASAASRAPTGP